MAGGCAIEEPDTEPDPGCEESARTFRIDEVVSPADVKVGADLDGDGSIDDRAGDLMRTLFSTYAEHDAAGVWREHMEERLAETAWTIEVPGCARGRVRTASMPDGVPLGALADLTGAADAGWHPVEPLELDVTLDGDELTGVVAGGLVDGYQQVIADALVPFLNSLDTAWTAQLDGNGDGTITSEELLANPAFAIFLAPDLVDALSFGLAIHATEDR